MAVLLTLFAVVLEPLALLLAAPFAVVAYLLWYQASGRLLRRVYASVERSARVDDAREGSRGGRRAAEADGGRGGFGAGPRETNGRGGRRRGRADAQGRRRAAEAGRNGRSRGARGRQGARTDRAPRTDSGPTAAEAYDILGVDASADQSAVRSAYRERVKETHPDRGGSEEEFKRVTAAYDRLSE
jgi:DnaJ-domain-containing protein 1